MATKDELIDAGAKLREQLFNLSQNGSYSADEREGFGRLHFYFHMTLERFTFYPAHGNASRHYDTPLSSVNEAFNQGLKCSPGNVDDQQAYYDMVHKATADIKSVTASVPRPFTKVR